MKTVKVEYVEQSKCITAKVNVEYSGDNIPTNSEIIAEAQEVFQKAHEYAILKTMAKNRKQ